MVVDKFVFDVRTKESEFFIIKSFVTIYNTCILLIRKTKDKHVNVIEATMKKAGIKPTL